MLRGIQRAFYPWFEASRHRFVVPVTVGRRERQRKRLRKREGLELKVVTPGYTFRPTLSVSGLVVPVYVDDEVWDIVYGINWITPRRVSGGYACKSYRPEHDKVYSSEEAVWRERVFEPFLSWVNVELAYATALAFYRDDDTTWAELVEGELEAPLKKSLVRLVPLDQSPPDASAVSLERATRQGELERHMMRSLAQIHAGFGLTAEESLARLEEDEDEGRSER